ncbi:TPA: hypothetical protein DCY67_03470 [Candidatus Acetothermia bacterium]|nr:hypothetical protein [Candidatus Acetothermia bacterium]
MPDRPCPGAVPFSERGGPVEWEEKEGQVNIVVPDLGEVGEVKLVRWLRAAGEKIEAGEAVAEVEADKVVFVIESPSPGTLGRVLVAEGQTTRPGEPIACLRVG